MIRLVPRRIGVPIRIFRVRVITFFGKTPSKAMSHPQWVVFYCPDWMIRLLVPRHNQTDPVPQLRENELQRTRPLQHLHVC